MTTLFILERATLLVTGHEVLSETRDRYNVSPSTPFTRNGRGWFPTPLTPGGVVFYCTEANAGEWSVAYSVDRERLLREVGERVRRDVDRLRDEFRKESAWLAGFAAEHEGA